MIVIRARGKVAGRTRHPAARMEVARDFSQRRARREIVEDSGHN
jgi:hypothetical protein